MYRPKIKRFSLLATLLVAVAGLGACSSTPPEQNILRQFFRASGLRDNQTLANFAAASFDPKSEGTVTDFTITNVTPEKTEPLQIISLNKALADAEAANKEFSDRKKTYQDANMEAIDRVLKAQASNKRLTGKDGQIMAEWEKWQQDTQAEAKKVSAARNALADARPVAELSLSTPNGEPPAIEAMDGTMVTKDVTIDATVKAPDGQTSQKNLVVTLQRAIVKGAKGEKPGKWVVTAVKPA